MKIATILGARPQFIKAAVVSRAFAQINEESTVEQIHEVIIHTGQHYDANMSDIFFYQMEIPDPAIKLNVNQVSHGAMTGRMLEMIEKVLIDEKPDGVLVYGDTNSTLAGALAAVKLHIPVAHVEAGLRSYNKSMPEEHNRILTDHISSVLFCPTRRAVENLKREGIKNSHSSQENGNDLSAQPCVHEVGDVMYDAAIYYSGRGSKSDTSLAKIIREYGNKQFILATVHREENTDQKEQQEQIVSSFCTLSEDKPVFWPVHPRTRKYLKQYNLEERLKRNPIYLSDPVGYFEMLELLNRCCLVLTDSGGLQKEAYFFKKPCVTLRNETEWVELVEHGFNKIAGAEKDSIVNSAKAFLEAEIDFSTQLYGSGNTGYKIAKILNSFFTS